MASHDEVYCLTCGVYWKDVHQCKDKWHLFYLNMAREFAKMAKDPRLHVGAVIVTNDGILYPGYNGWEKGGTNEPDSLEPGQSGTVHAEANAILKFNPTIHKNSKMYLTHNPCIVCARMIVNTQAISEVYYGEEYRDTRGIQILRERGVYCEKVG
jgi:dCMP deaminase